MNPNPDSPFWGLNPNPAKKALNPDLNPNPDSHITGAHAQSETVLMCIQPENPDSEFDSETGFAHTDGTDWDIWDASILTDVWGMSTQYFTEKVNPIKYQRSLQTG